jgi:hypothetical protein
MVKIINVPADGISPIYNTFFKDFNINNSEPGTVVLLDKGELLSSVIELIDVNVENLGITIHRETFSPRANPEEYKIDINNVKFDRFSKLKMLCFQWSYIGMNNETLNNCKNIEYLYLATPFDYPFDENNCSSLYTMTKLRKIVVSGWGLPRVGDGFIKYVNEKQNCDKEFQYSYYF